MYLYARGMDLSSLNDYLIEFWKLFRQFDIIFSHYIPRMYIGSFLRYNLNDN